MDGATTLTAIGIACAVVQCAQIASAADATAPMVIAPTSDGALLVIDTLGHRGLVVDPASGATEKTIDLPAGPSGATVRGNIAYVTTLESAGRILTLDLVAGTVRHECRAGHMPMAPVLSPDGRVLCVANRFENRVRIIDLPTGNQRTVAVVREPVAVAFSPDGHHLFVANHLPDIGPALDDENPDIAAVVSAIDARDASVISHIRLPNGSHSLRGIAASPDGKRVVVTHILSNYMPPPVSPEEGAVNMNVFSLLDAETLQWIQAVSLDQPGRGAANPWAVAFASDGRRLLVTHAGTHELSVIDFPALLGRIASRPRPFPCDRPDLSLLDGIRARVALRINGPRSVTIAGDTAFACGFFSGSIASVDLALDAPGPRLLGLDAHTRPSLARIGEANFNDATLCFEGWQSCASCHPDGRSDSLYWDLMNDGAANTKNTKSLLMSALMSPVMWRGVREDAAAAVRSGFRHILLSAPIPPDAEEAIIAYLREMPAVPSPFRNADRPDVPQTEDASCAKCHAPGASRGSLTPQALRGKQIFEGSAGCVGCHPHPLFTTTRALDPGLGSGVMYRIPSLIEVWRTAPYLHSGDATTLRETITDFNHLQKRGRTSHLTPRELDDLIEYLRSL